VDETLDFFLRESIISGEFLQDSRAKARPPQDIVSIPSPDGGGLAEDVIHENKSVG
jgi:hypothetical protein